MSEAFTDAAIDQIDDCWNRTGIRGDGSCPSLIRYIHCSRCPTHALAARQILDRLSVDSVMAADTPAPADDDSGPRHSTLVFRLGEEWLGLPTRLLREIADSSRIHSLPHRRTGGTLGVVNIRGSLGVCVSLASLLGLPATPAAVTGQRARPRLLVVGRQGAPVAFPVDDVHGIERFADATLTPPPATVAGHGNHFSTRVARWRDHGVGLLDEARLMAALNRNLA